VPVGDDDAVAVADWSVPVAVEDGVGAALDDAVRLAVPVKEAVMPRDSEMELVCVGVVASDAVGELELVRDGDAPNVSDAVAVPVDDDECVDDAVIVWLDVAVSELVGVAPSVSDGVVCAVKDGDTPRVSVRVMGGVADALTTDALTVLVDDAVGVVDSDVDADDVAVALAVPVAVAAALLDADAPAVTLLVAVPVPVAVLVGVNDGDPVKVADTLGDADCDALTEPDRDSDADRVGDRVGQKVYGTAKVCTVVLAVRLKATMTLKSMSSSCICVPTARSEQQDWRL
jgi:hypothetical protein